MIKYNAEYYMHEMDKMAFDALNKFPKLVKLKQAYIANTAEKSAKIEMLSKAIRLGEDQYPEIYNLLPPICGKLDINIPELYLVPSINKKDLNAATIGVENPVIYLSSELVKQATLDQIKSVLAHECGHIACKHCVYHDLAESFINGIENSPLTKIPAVNKYITPTLVRALLFWYRCSELSADRAAVLCDGSPDTTIDVLLKINGYDVENLNREAFIKQALDLKKFVNESDANKMMEYIMVQWKTHPVMATRAYECYEFANSEQFKEIINGTYQEKDDSVEEEVIDASVTLSSGNDFVIPMDTEQYINKRLGELNTEIERYTNYADKADYAYAVGCGIIWGALDSAFFSDTTIFENDLGFSHRQVNEFIQEYAASRGLGGDRLKDAISDLEQSFKVAQDNVWKGADIGVAAKNHHLADLAHHPTPVGLMSSLIVQFLRIGTFVNRNGEWHFIFVETKKEDIIRIAAPAIITGFLNWLVAIAENKYEAENGKEVPKALHVLAHTIASTPEIIEVIKCADNWFGHLVSDMGGSKNTAGGGMGIPGVFISLLYEIASLPVLKDSGIPEIVNDLYVNKKIDLRHELAYSEQLKLQAIPVILNEISVRIGYMLATLAREIAINKGLKGVNWRRVIPFANRTVDRMMMIAAMTFNVIDTGDAALRAAIESGGDWVIFSGRFVARYNYIGAGRAALSIVKEFSNEKKEAQLLHEKMLLMNAKAEIMFLQLQQFKAQLNEKLSNYLAEDIEAFIEGFDYMKEGLSTGDSDLAIKGNVIIQKVLGREPQFTNQKEFDDLMESDDALQL